jgi:hypothetical protein
VVVGDDEDGERIGENSEGGVRKFVRLGFLNFEYKRFGVGGAEAVEDDVDEEDREDAEEEIEEDEEIEELGTEAVTE